MVVRIHAAQRLSSRFRSEGSLSKGTKDRVAHLGSMLWFSVAELFIEANSVIASRLSLMATGAITFTEIQLMVSEKLSAAAEASVILATGGGFTKVVFCYQRRVKDNVRRFDSASMI